MKKTQKVLSILKFIELQDITADEAQRIISEIESNSYREDEWESQEDEIDRLEAQDWQY